MEKGNERYEKLDLFKFPPCPVCGKELIAPFGGPFSNGEGQYLECEDFKCGFQYKIDNDGDETIILKRYSVNIIKDYMKQRMHRGYKIQ